MTHGGFIINNGNLMNLVFLGVNLLLDPGLTPSNPLFIPNLSVVVCKVSEMMGYILMKLGTSSEDLQEF